MTKLKTTKKDNFSRAGYGLVIPRRDRRDFSPSTTLTVAHLFPLGRITTYSPFRLEFSKTGYETYILDHPIDAEIDMTVSLKTAYNQIFTLDGDVVSLQQPELGTSSELLII